MALSYREYAGDDVTVQYTFNFDYIKQAYVHAYVYDPLVKSRPEAADEVSFAWINATTIELASPAGTSHTLRIVRETVRTALVDFVGGSTLTEADLDKNAMQLIHIAQEADDTVTDQTADSVAARVLAQAAQAAAELAETGAEDAEDGAQAAQAAAVAARSGAETAEDGAQAAQAAAESALASAQLPVIQAGDANKALLVKDDETGYELGQALPAISAGDAGKHLAVNSGEDGGEWVDPPSPIQVRSFVLLGAVQEDADAFIVPCGIAGTVVKVAARLRSGTSCAVTFKHNGATTIGSVTANTTGASSAGSQACGELDYVQIGTGTLSGTPTDIFGFIWIQPS
ncbi:hypothetical protein KKH36_04300 [Patescibacteria group bacterium]|nr:hypothetical protein [Patescibacteria group bacterium]